VAQELALARRREGRLAVVLIDLDRFKEVNDTLGHGSGDLLLRALGPRLRRVLREGDTVARLGGDEFAVLLPDVDDAEAALALADRVRRVLEEPLEVDSLLLETEASIGIALYPEHGDDVDTLLRHADVAMYRAKEAHEDVALYTTEDDHYSPARLALLSGLRRALEERQLVLHFQPTAHVGSGEVRRVEALLRWQHPERGLLQPAEFLPLAERTGLMRGLTLYVLEEALRQSRAWQDEGIELGVAVNLSPRDLQNLDLPDQVAALLAAHRVEPRFLELELTESTILTDPLRARAVLLRLSELGVRIAIDDFGSGYSSLGYLTRLPVDVLKIDKSFVQNMREDESDAVIVRSTIELGHNLGLEVVAEGVECERTWGDLLELGCDVVQGFFLSRPVPPAELAAWLRARRAGEPSEREQAARPPLSAAP
jgi:diguanylate cyclase (GGDEF)-like protein